MAMRPMLIFPSCCSALADLGLTQITLQYVTTERVALSSGDGAQGALCAASAAKSGRLGPWHRQPHPYRNIAFDFPVLGRIIGERQLDRAVVNPVRWMFNAD